MTCRPAVQHAITELQLPPLYILHGKRSENLGRLLKICITLLQKCSSQKHTGLDINLPQVNLQIYIKSTYAEHKTVNSKRRRIREVKKARCREREREREQASKRGAGDKKEKKRKRKTTKEAEQD